jgi:RHS repeat-associated protein
MLEARYQQNTPGSVTNADGTIKYGFAWNNVGDNDSYLAYDLNGRITSQRSGGATTAGVYNYQPNSYKLDNVNPPVSPASARPMTAGNFEYNGRGAMTYDRSLDVSVEYGWDLRPTRFVRNARSGGVMLEQYHFYDADGNRVAKVNAYFDGTQRYWIEGRHYVSLMGRIAKEMFQGLGSDGSPGPVSQTPLLYGSSLLGRLQNGNPEFFLTNHQGSLMMTVDKSGEIPEEGDLIMDYTAYGLHKPVVMSARSLVTQGYTGKEFDDAFGLTYFGARFYDPELGIWRAPDAAAQFFNPYGFSGGDPVTSIDPDGLWKLGLGISIGWTKKGGFSLGLGVGVEDVSVAGLKLDTYAGADRNFKDGSTTYSANVGAKACIGVCLGGSVGGSYNTISGYTVNASASVGVGISGYGDVGLEVGTNQYWTRGGDYIGGDVYGEVYAESYGVRAAVGYSQGIGAVQSGFYGEVSAFGANLSYSQNGGLNYGASHRFKLASYSSSGGLDYVGQDLVKELMLPEDRVALPEYSGSCLPGECKGWFGTNYVGPTDENQVKTLGEGLTGPLDLGAFYHDKGYMKGEAAGIPGALFGIRTPVVAADLKLAARSWAAFGNYMAGGLVSDQQGRGSLGTAVVFSAIGTYKAAAYLIKDSY